MRNAESSSHEHSHWFQNNGLRIWHPATIAVLSFRQQQVVVCRSDFSCSNIALTLVCHSVMAACCVLLQRRSRPGHGAVHLGRATGRGNRILVTSLLSQTQPWTCPCRLPVAETLKRRSALLQHNKMAQWQFIAQFDNKKGVLLEQQDIKVLTQRVLLKSVIVGRLIELEFVPYKTEENDILLSTISSLALWSIQTPIQ